MNSGQKSPIPSINSQGRITTQNPELLSLLRENSTDRFETAELSSPSRNRSAAETFKLEQPERLMKAESPEKYHEDRRSPTNETPSREYFPEQSSGSPTRSKSVASVKEQNVNPEHVSQRESFIDSLEQPRRSEKLEDSLEVDDDPHAKHYDTEPNRTTPVSYPKPIPVESSTEFTRPSSRTIQETRFEPDSTSSYSSKRLKGRDSSQRKLLQISSTSAVHPEAPRAYPSSDIPNDDKNSYHFSAKDTGPIRDLLNTDAEPEVEDPIEKSDAVEPRGNSSKTYNVLPKEETDIVDNPEIKVETMDPSAPARMYVDSPTFTPQEEDEYRFVQSRLDDQEDFKDNATYRELDRNALKGDKDVALESNREWNTTGQEHESYARARDSAQKQYVMRPSSQKPSTTNSRHQPGLPHKKQIDAETPEPFFPDSIETSTEDSELERERNYQKELQERLANQVVTDADLLIPRLNLPDESVEYVRDSLDYDDDDDDDTYRDTDKTLTEFAVRDNGEWVNPPQNPYRYPQPQYGNHEYNAYQNAPEQYQNIYQGQQANQHYPSEQNAYQPQNQNMFYHQQMPYQGNPHQGYDPYYSVHPQEQQQQQQHPPGALARYPTQTEAEYFIELPQSKMDQNSSASRSPRRPGVDYVEKNKQNIFRSKPGTTYSELKHRKLEIEQQKAEKPPSRNIVKIGKTVKPVKEEQVNVDSENESIFQNENNAETTWKNRSVSLAQHKKGKPKGKKIAKLQKYPTDSGFLPTSDQQGTGETEFSGQHPNAGRDALSTGNLSPSRRPLVLKPITQEVWTEDGQRISVDINLKLMSPPPAAGPPPFMTRQHPLGPISQEQHQANAAQVIYSARDPPTEWQQAMHPTAEQGSPFHQGQGYVGYASPQRKANSGQEGYRRQIPQPMYPNSKQQNPAVHPLRSDFDKFKKHQHNVEQQQLIQQQIYQQQLAKKQQLQQQLQQLQLEGQVDPGQTYYQSYGDEGMYEGGYPGPPDQIDAPNLESDQQNYPASATEMNPYNRIPPISMGGGQMNYTQPKESPRGYANQFMEKKIKEQRKPDYKVYTLDDYRKMQKEVRLGGLGPDLDSETFRDKAGKKIRQENYAREVMMRNKQTSPKSRPPVYPKQKETDDLLPRSRVAKEYAKNVPKPKVRPKESQYNSYEVSAQMSPVGQRKQMKQTPGSPGQSPQRTTPTNNIDVIDLQKLHQRHERDKHNVAMMRQNMEII